MKRGTACGSAARDLYVHVACRHPLSGARVSMCVTCYGVCQRRLVSPVRGSNEPRARRASCLSLCLCVPAAGLGGAGVYSVAWLTARVITYAPLQLAARPACSRFCRKDRRFCLPATCSRFVGGTCGAGYVGWSAPSSARSPAAASISIFLARWPDPHVDEPTSEVTDEVMSHLHI